MYLHFRVILHEIEMSYFYPCDTVERKHHQFGTLDVIGQDGLHSDSHVVHTMSREVRDSAILCAAFSMLSELIQGCLFIQLLIQFTQASLNICIVLQSST